MENLYVKRATIDDVKGIIDITREAFTHYAKKVGIKSMDALCETYEKVKSDVENKYVYVAYIDKEIVGSVRIEVKGQDKSAYLSRFGVSCKHQNMGVGKKLMELVDSEMTSLGVKKLCLHTASKVGSLIVFYYKAGFYIQSVSENRGYYRALLVKEY